MVGTALPASNVTTPAGGLGALVNPGSRPSEQSATCQAEPPGVLSGRGWVGEARDTSDQSALSGLPRACCLEEGV